MDTVIETTTTRMSRNLAGTIPRLAPLVALAAVAKLRPNMAVVRLRTAQDGQVEVARE